jgi:hypothetical protein
MKRKRNALRRSAAQWAQLLAGWDRNSMTAADFARHLGVAPGTLAWWRWKLDPRHGSITPRQDEPRLVRLDLHHEPEAEPQTWEFTSASGHTLRIRGAIDPQMLRIVLDRMTARGAP